MQHFNCTLFCIQNFTMKAKNCSSFNLYYSISSFCVINFWLLFVNLCAISYVFCVYFSCDYLLRLKLKSNLRWFNYVSLWAINSSVLIYSININCTHCYFLYNVLFCAGYPGWIWCTNKVMLFVNTYYNHSTNSILSSCKYQNDYYYGSQDRLEGEVPNCVYVNVNHFQT